VRFLRGRTRAPIGLAAFLSVPLFFSALMASSLAIEKPHIVHGHELPPTTATEVRIWLLALVAPAILLLVGVLAIALGRHGLYVSAVAAIVLVLAVTHNLDQWTRRHTLRFPLGVDLIGANNAAGNKLDPGQWEQTARETSLSLGHWAIGLAAAAIVIAALLEFRRVRRLATAYQPPPPEVADTVAVVPPSLDDSSRR
jgi:Flp pilus assembly protein TadB